MKKEVKIGIFSLGMILLLFWGINFLKGKSMFTSTNTYYTSFRDVDGLAVSGDVMFRGMKVGTITGIKFNPQSPENIVVEFTVPKKYPVPNDSRMSTINPYIVGGKIMVVEYGHSAVMYQDGDTIPSNVKPQIMSQLTDGFDVFKEQAADLIVNLNQALGSMGTLLSEENVKNISETMAGVNHIVNNDLKKTVANLNSLTGKLNDNTEQIDRILVNIGDVTDSLAAANIPMLVGNINQTVEELNDVIASVTKGEGNLAMLLNDPGLYEALKDSSENLAALLEDMKAHPKRYVHFSVFGKKDK